MLEKLEEKYQGKSQFYETKYSVVFWEKRDSDLEVIDTEKFKIGAGEYLNAYHQLKGERNLTEKKQTILDDIIYNSYLQKEDMKLRERTQRNNKKRTFQKVDMEMM